MTPPHGWERESDDLGLWEHRGEVAVAGVGHSPMDRRWDGQSMDKTLGAYSMVAARRAIEDAGISPDEIDGVISCPGPLGDFWAPRPYFEPPYDSEDGLTLVTAEWLTRELGLKNVTYLNSNAPQIGKMLGLAAQVIADGLTSTCLVLYPTGNVGGRYKQSGEAAVTSARGDQQWHAPWGHHSSSMQQTAFMFKQYCRQYGTNHDRLAPFVINQRRNGLRTPWGYYTLHEPYQLTIDDYLSARWLTEPVSLLDADRPVQASACYLMTTAERAKEMKQKPVYVLSHAQTPAKHVTTMTLLDEHEESSYRLAQRLYNGAGVGPDELDIFNPFDGFTLFTQVFLESFGWHGVKRGEAHDFYAEDITTEGPHPFCSSGGNNGTGRTRTAIFTDCIEQLRGTAGERQVRVRAETAAAGCNTPALNGNGFVLFGSVQP